MKYAQVIVSITNKEVDKIFTYGIPNDINNQIQVGMRVKVSFGIHNILCEGYVIGFSDTVDFPKSRLKYILSLSDKYPIFNENMIELAKWMQDKYYCTLADCLQCIMPKVTNDKTQKYVYINYDIDNVSEIIKGIIKKDNMQSKVLSFLLENDGERYSNIIQFLGISSSPLLTLEKNNIIKILDVEVKRNVLNVQDFEQTLALNSTEEQKNAIDFIKNSLNKKNRKNILIHGVTGSGKTEVYLQVIQEVIKNGKEAIVLVPEISLTPQTVERFIQRFGSKVTVTHSRLSGGERFDQWKKARTGEISIMIGPRSAIFTPFKNLGIIIIDEEHETTYKSESTPKYDTKEVAFKISEISGALVLLGSATPSLKSYYDAKNGKLELINIKNRINNQFPQVSIVDMREELKNGNKSIFSVPLFEAIKYNIDNKRQTILFLNRRGHSTFVSCRSCGFVMKCDNCNVNYTYHREENILICHYCGISKPISNICPSCGSKYIKYFGVGTQKVEQEVAKYFPAAKILRMDLDTTSKKNSHNAILSEFKSGRADILIGTQMIAKGLDFPNVTLVGVIAADTSLNAGDYRCAETTFQLLAQVAGRSGRAKEKGRVFIQTYTPEHYSIVYVKENDYQAFYNEEINIRECIEFPPFSNLFLILFSGKDEKDVILKIKCLKELLNKYNKNNMFQSFGPAPATISKIKSQYRWKILVKGQDEEKVKNYVLYCMDKLRKLNNINGISVNLTLNPNFVC